MVLRTLQSGIVHVARRFCAPCKVVLCTLQNGFAHPAKPFRPPCKPAPRKPTLQGQGAAQIPLFTMKNGFAHLAKRFCAPCKTVLHTLQNGFAQHRFVHPASRFCAPCKAVLCTLQNGPVQIVIQRLCWTFALFLGWATAAAIPPDAYAVLVLLSMG
jgi:hypothetical protein